MDTETQVENHVSPTETTESKETETQAPSQENPVKDELERVERRKRTPLEKLEFTKQRIEQQIADERAKSGIVEDEDDKPLTLRDLKALQQQEAFETASSLVDAIEDEHERKLTKFHLENTIKPSGNPQTDFQNAKLLVDAVKNGQLVQEIARTKAPKNSSSNSGAPARQKDESELTKQELIMTKPPFNLTKEEIIKARR